MTDPAPVPATHKDGWKIRRRVILLTLLYCAATVGYLAIWGADTVLHQQIAFALTGLAGMVIGSYVFGAVWDDHNIRMAVGKGDS